MTLIQINYPVGLNPCTNSNLCQNINTKINTVNPLVQPRKIYMHGTPASLDLWPTPYIAYSLVRVFVEDVCYQ